MLINTHIVIAKKIYENMDSDKRILLKEIQFVWGNVKPDCVSKYKFKKHYLDESFVMIINKIEFLSSLSIKDLYTKYNLNKFNQELGVICHFLCDYFCLPHNKRWEFKNANVVKEHINYERSLDKIAKVFKFTSEKNNYIEVEEVATFIKLLIKEYEKVEGYKNDLIYANYACNTIVNTVLRNVIENEYKLRRAETL